MPLIRNELSDGCLEDADVPAYRLAGSQALALTMTSPVQKSTESPSEQRHWQASGEPKKKHAQSGAEHATKKHSLTANSIAQSAPENSTDALHECER